MDVVEEWSSRTQQSLEGKTLGVLYDKNYVREVVLAKT